MLRQLGFRAEIASSGLEGLRRCARTMPDVVLLDWQMPGLGGWDVLPALRGFAGGAKAVVLLITAQRDPVVVGHAMALGADEALMKPFDAEIMGAKLAQAGVM
jgi:two-component system chemotaxis response regulator CheY